MTRARASRRFARLGRWCVHALGLLIALVIALVVLVVMTANLPFARELVRERVNAALAPRFVGSIVIDRVGVIGLFGVANIDAHVVDSRGRKVVVLRGLRATSLWPQLVEDALAGRPLTVTLQSLRVEQAAIVLFSEPHGPPSIVTAFQATGPAPAKGPASPTAGATPSAPPSIRIRRFEVGHASVRSGDPGAALAVDIANAAASFAYDRDGVVAKLEPARVRARGLPFELDPSGVLEADVSLPQQRENLRRAHVEFRGWMLQARTELRAELRGDEVSASFQAADVPAAALRERWRATALEAPTSLTATAKGTLPQLAVDARLENAALRLAAHADLDVGARKHGTLRLRLAAQDARRLLASLPLTRVDGELTAHVSVDRGGALDCRYDLAVTRAHLTKGALPGVQSQGRIARHDARWAGDGVVSLDERGAHARVVYEVGRASNGDTVADATLSSTVSNPPRLSALGARANGTLSARVRLNLSRPFLDAELTAKFSRVAVRRNELAGVSVRGLATGPLSAPNLRVGLRTDAARIGAERLSHVALLARGSPHQLTIDGRSVRDPGQRLRLHTLLEPRPSLTLRDSAVQIESERESVELRVQRLRVGDRALQLEHATLSGAGAGTAAVSGSFGGGRMHVEFSAERLQVAPWLRALAVRSALHSAVITGRGRLSGPLGHVRGQLELHARDVAIDGVHGGNIDVSLFRDERTDVHVDLTLGRSRLSADVRRWRSDGFAFGSGRLPRVQGSFALNGALDVHSLVPILRACGAPIERAYGSMSLALRVDAPVARPLNRAAVFARVQTRDLVIAPRRSAPASTTGLGAQSWLPAVLTGVDADVALMTNGFDQNARLDAKLLDYRGELASLSVETKLPAHPSAHLAGALAGLPLRADLRVPPRRLAKLPNFLRPRSLHGTIDAHVTAQGTVRDPHVEAAIAVHHLTTRGHRRALDAHFEARYGQAGGRLALALASGRERVLTLASHWRGDLVSDWARREPAGKPRALALDADLELARFPLAVIPQLLDREIRGDLSGKLVLRQLGRNPTLSGTIESDTLTLDGAAPARLLASFGGNRGGLSADVRVKQTDGELRANVRVPVVRRREALPAVTAATAKAELHADHFDLRALRPVFGDRVSALRGRLDATLTAERNGRSRFVRGRARVSEGALQVPELGHRFANVAAELSVDETSLSLTRLEMDLGTGHVSTTARAQLDNGEVRSATAQVRVRRSRKVPVIVNAQPLATAWGAIDLAYASAARRRELRVDVRQLHLQMSETPIREVQSLEPASGVRVGVVRDGQFEHIPLQRPERAPNAGSARELAIAVHLGPSVWVQRGEQLSVQLGGDLTITRTQSAEPIQIEGNIDLRGGSVDVNGKTFRIERGTVSFAGTDARNPTIVAVARWVAPTGYAVYAEYAGSVASGKLTLRADPPLTQSQILNLIVLGTPEGRTTPSGGSVVGSAASTAVSALGSTAAKGFGRALSNLTRLDVSARIDTSTGQARPELVLHVTSNVTTRVTRALGEPAAGENPDRTFLTVELRMARAWILQAVVGDRGTSILNAIWSDSY